MITQHCSIINSMVNSQVFSLFLVEIFFSSLKYNFIFSVKLNKSENRTFLNFKHENKTSTKHLGTK